MRAPVAFKPGDTVMVMRGGDPLWIKDVKPVPTDARAPLSSVAWSGTVVSETHPEYAQFDTVVFSADTVRDTD